MCYVSFCITACAIFGAKQHGTQTIFRCVGGAHMFVCDKSDIAIDKNSMFKYFSWNNILHLPQRRSAHHSFGLFSLHSRFFSGAVYFFFFVDLFAAKFSFILSSLSGLIRIHLYQAPTKTVDFDGVGVGIVPDDIDVVLLHAHRGRHHHQHHPRDDRLRLHGYFRTYIAESCVPLQSHINIWW